MNMLSEIGKWFHHRPPCFEASKDAIKKIFKDIKYPDLYLGEGNVLQYFSTRKGSSGLAAITDSILHRTLKNCIVGDLTNVLSEIGQ